MRCILFCIFSCICNLYFVSNCNCIFTLYFCILHIYLLFIQPRPQFASGLGKKFDNFNFTKEESEAGYKNFCVIQCKIKSIEWLYLAAKGHRRALIDFNGSKKFTWLVP